MYARDQNGLVFSRVCLHPLEKINLNPASLYATGPQVAYSHTQSDSKSISFPRTLKEGNGKNEETRSKVSQGGSDPSRKTCSALQRYSFHPSRISQRAS